MRRWAPDLRPDTPLLIVENQRFLNHEGSVDPEGRAVAVVHIGKIRPFLPEDVAAACARYYEPGWLAWEIIAMRPVYHPAAVLAARGIYDLPLTISILGDDLSK